MNSEAVLKRFLQMSSHKWYGDAFLLYCFYYYQLRDINRNNRLYITKGWTRRCTGLTERRLAGARKLLEIMELSSPYYYDDNEEIRNWYIIITEIKEEKIETNPERNTRRR